MALDHGEIAVAVDIKNAYTRTRAADFVGCDLSHNRHMQRQHDFIYVAHNKVDFLRGPLRYLMLLGN